MERDKLVCVLLAAGTLLAACASSPPEKSPFEWRAEAVSFALTEDVASRVVTQDCKPVGPEIASAAWNARDRWWERNADLVMAADHELRGNLIGATGPQREASRAFLGLQITAEVVELGQHLASQRLGEHGPTAESCAAELAQYRSGARDLGTNDSYFPHLVDMQYKSQSGQWQELLARIRPSAPEATFGDALFVVERLVRRHGCPSHDVRLLEVDPPFELYAARCAGRSQLVVQCEWNDCRVLSD